MIIIVEGIDRVGKTTLCKKLQALGFLYLKDEWMLSDSIEKEEIPIYSIGKLDTTVTFLKQLEAAGNNIVMDRCHLTEWVYGQVSRGNARVDLLRKIDWILSSMNAGLVYVYPEDIERSNREAGLNMNRHEEMFRMLANGTAMAPRYFTKYSEIDTTIMRILKDSFKYDIYFASPFFNTEQVEREEALKSILRGEGFKVFSPKENCFLPPDSDNQAQKLIFMQNCNAIKDCFAVFAVTDGKDMGTVWEAGYAFGIKRPVVYFAETLGNRGFNLMLAQSGKQAFLDRQSVTKQSIINALLGSGEEYRGLIE
ncbi:MAG: nucleoside 2-deoxyribosyltransferase [Clostridia bacterium]|nr:nucleoside 2-deoxyribosyltransferase [Clostridia bacterium]